MKDCQKDFLEPSSSTIVSSSTNTVSLQLSKAALDVIHELLVRFDLDGDNSWSVDELNLYQKETGDIERINSVTELVALFSIHNVPLTKDSTLDKQSLITLYQIQGEDALIRDINELVMREFSLGEKLQRTVSNLLKHSNESVATTAWKSEYSMKRDLAQIEQEEEEANKKASEIAKRKGWVGVYDLTSNGRRSSRVGDDDIINSSRTSPSILTSRTSPNILSKPPTLIHEPQIDSIFEKPMAIYNNTLGTPIMSQTNKDTETQSHIRIETTVTVSDSNIHSNASELSLPMPASVLKEETQTEPPKPTSASLIEPIVSDPQTKNQQDKPYSLPRPPSLPSPLTSSMLESSSKLPLSIITSARSATNSPKTTSPTSSFSDRRLQTVKLALASAVLGIPRAGSLPPAGVSWLTHSDVETVLSDFDIMPTVYVTSEAEAGAQEWLNSPAGLSALHAEESRLIREQVESGIVSNATELFVTSKLTPGGIPNQSIKCQAQENLFLLKSQELSSSLTTDPKAACDMFWQYVADTRSNKWPPLVPLTSEDVSSSKRSIPDTPGSITYPQGFESWLRWRETRRRISAKAFKTWSKTKDDEKRNSPISILKDSKIQSGQVLKPMQLSITEKVVTNDKMSETNTVTNPQISVDQIKENQTMIEQQQSVDQITEMKISSETLRSTVDKSFKQTETISTNDDFIRPLSLFSHTSDLNHNQRNPPRVIRQSSVVNNDDDNLSDTEVLVNAVVEVAGVLARRLAKERLRKSAEKDENLLVRSQRQGEFLSFENDQSFKPSSSSSDTITHLAKGENTNSLVVDDMSNIEMSPPTRSSFYESSQQSQKQFNIEVPTNIIESHPISPDTSFATLPEKSLTRALKTSPILQSIASALGGYLQEARSDIEIRTEAENVVDRSIANSQRMAQDRSEFINIAEKTFLTQLSVLSDPRSPSFDILNTSQLLLKSLKEMK
jgi:hypothetical protein